jgi:hypothetical protein
MIMGIYFSKIEVRGPGKESAKLTFQTGLNILSGASDTGKSYVFECIDFILGSKESPKDVEEADGYNEVRAELKTYDGKIFSISRKFEDAKIYLVEAPLSDFDSNEQIQLSAKHDNSADDNLSSYLLDLLGLKGKKLKFNAKNVKRIISFRDCARFSLISESRIITKESPIYSGQYSSRTVEESFFRLLLSGIDDDELESIEDPKTAKNKIKGRIEELDDIIANKRKDVSKLLDELSKIEQEEINIQIDELSKQLDDANKSVIREEEKRQEIWLKINNLKAEVNHINELLNRFGLLKEHYSSDLKRLDFINEGGHFIEQLVDKPCPICGTLFTDDKTDAVVEDSNIEHSLKSEHFKISKKLEDLQDTISGLVGESDQKKEDIKKALVQFDEIDAFIKSKLRPVYNINAEKLSKYMALKNSKAQVESLNSEITGLLSNKKYYEEKMAEKQQKAVSKVLAEDFYNGLLETIKQIIIGWGLPCDTIAYDKTKNDIEINGKLRANFGKGYRAIYLSAFMIGVMKYCRQNSIKHPFFVILDSPLISFKEKDADPDDDKLPEEIKDAFYRYLADMEDINQMQIFVIENKEQPADINDKCTHEHFSKNKNAGRYGFLPV